MQSADKMNISLLTLEAAIAANNGGFPFEKITGNRGNEFVRTIPGTLFLPVSSQIRLSLFL